jgi:pimeloyl-ACP methyl ester carboxylesterase
LLDALGVTRAHWCGNSQGGHSAIVAVITYPERVGKFVLGWVNGRYRRVWDGCS